jgi:hypothetical protein
MAKRVTLEQLLADVAAAKSTPRTDVSLATLRAALAGKWAYAATKAAELAAEHELEPLTDALVAAFDHWMTHSGEDKNCAAKTAIADALYRIGYPKEGVFLQGIRHLQMEPVFGGRVDTAAHLRGVCALGLVRMNYADAMTEIAELLADPEHVARAGAARALGYRGGDDAAPLLRFKLRVGDAEPEVLTECLVSLLRLTPKPAIALAEKLLNREQAEDRIDALVLALGQSRQPAAFDVLRRRTDAGQGGATTLLAIAMIRTDAALAYLHELVATAPPRVAADAVRALATYRHDAALRAKVQQAVDARRDRALSAAFAASFA